jgi:hypothetical protein
MPLDPLGVRVPPLGQVQLQRLPPRRTGLLILAERGVRAAQPVESVGDFVRVADVTEKHEIIGLYHTFMHYGAPASIFREMLTDSLRARR